MSEPVNNTQVGGAASPSRAGCGAAHKPGDLGANGFSLSVHWFSAALEESDEILCLSSRAYLLQSVLVETSVFSLRGKSDCVMPLLKEKSLQ